jgi:hypothetical protein
LDHLAVAALTDFILAAEAFFVAGLLIERPKTRFSAAWFWGLAMLMLAVGAFLGGVDHGFVQPIVDAHGRMPIQHSTWLALGVLTFATLQAMIRQFLPAPWWRIGTGVAAVQLVLFAVSVPLFNSFAVVVANYAPVMLLALFLNIRGLRDGSGSWPMIAGIAVVLAASSAHAARLGLSASIDYNGVYHVGMMIAVLLTYRGGLRLKGFGE